MKLLRNRDFILSLALGLGLLWGWPAQWTQRLTLPALAVVMMVSTTAISGSAFRSPKVLIGPALGGIVMNYVVLTGLILGLSALFIHDEQFWMGFVLVAAVPAGVAVVPFSGMLNGNVSFALLATLGCYLGALIITPAITLGLLGTAFINPAKVFIIMVELILIPLIASRVLLWTGLARHVEPIKGTIVNWSFFLLVYTIVGLNRDVFVGRPLSLLPVGAIALASTFVLGFGIEFFGRLLRIDRGTNVSLVLLGTVKNYGLSAGLALALFGKATAVPSTVSSVFFIVYVIWLNVRKQWKG